MRFAVCTVPKTSATKPTLLLLGCGFTLDPSLSTSRWWVHPIHERPKMDRTLTPTSLREWLQGISLDTLREIAAAVTRELDRREGRQKYRLPDHVERIL